MTHAEIERDEIIERYILGRLSGDEEAAFEEHYLACEACQGRLREERRLIGRIRQAAEEWPKRPRAGRQWLFPAPAWGVAALAAAAVYVSAVLPPSVLRTPGSMPGPLTVAPIPVVELHTYRAGVAEAGRAPANRPFLLRLDLRGAPGARDCTVEIVGETGEPAWSGTGLTAAQDRAEVRVERGLPAGRYLVRVSGEGRLLREYGLRVEP